ncbi:MAG TPA: XrtA system polysaccharide deacetylase [Candidatus Polarisedimenticolaceae bacterium]|nr:XrtA system polysaccharide deacetylase [Candidatus Polarisedimenticolaceae bacterium]
MTERKLNAFTVDVEDYFQVSAFEALFPREQWGQVELRVDAGVRALLEIAAEAQVKGTFYILGWLARQRPDLVRAIAEAGHEIGCHSLEHRLVYTMTPEAFRNDLRAALSAIRDACGVASTLYRAPSYSITPASLWALDILAEEGILIDSSIYPITHDRYGMSGAPLGPYRPLRHQPQFVEFPPSAVRLFGANLPCAGGGYLRALPLALTRTAIRRINGVEGRAALVYVHPWELDPGQPRVPAKTLQNLRHRLNIGKTAGRLRLLLREFPFAPLSTVLSGLGGPSVIPFQDLAPFKGLAGAGSAFDRTEKA